MYGAGLSIRPHCSWITCGVLSFLSFVGLPAAGIAQCTPETVLTGQFGLSCRPNSTIWITPREHSLRRSLDQLPGMVNALRDLHTKISEERARNALAQAQRQAKEKAGRKKFNKLSPNDPARKTWERQLDSIAVPPDKLGGAPVMQRLLIDASNMQNAILITISSCRTDIATLPNEYTTLQQNAAVAEAIGQLGGGHRLGPIKDYSADLRLVNQSEAVVVTLPHVIYLQSGQVRLGAIMNDRTPLTFTWRPGKTPTLITSSIAQSAGIQIDPAATTVMAPNTPGRQIPARQVTLESLRFGKHVLTNVTAFVLPPEAEDYGAQIGPEAFAGFEVKPDPVLLQLTIQGAP